MDEIVSFEQEDVFELLRTILHKEIKMNVIQYRIRKLAGFITIKDKPTVFGFTIKRLLLSLGNETAANKTN